MKYLLYILLFPYYLVKLFIKGFKKLSLFFSRGFYFYFEKFFTLLKKITHISFFDRLVLYFQRRREDPTHIVLVVVWFLTLLYLFDFFHVDNQALVQDAFRSDIKPNVQQNEDGTAKNDNLLLNKEFNLFRIYGKYKQSDINFDELLKTNSDVKAWIIVEGTNINYPVVQTTDNDYYLNHSFDKSYSISGWVFMDYRNDSNLLDDNTIIYGHNLLNKTAFGSVDNIFKAKLSEYKIKIITPNYIYTYKVFSAYYIDPETYYLQNTFYDASEYESFLNTISKRNILPIDNSVSKDNKILTLSTCTDDNKGRKVIHAKLISTE